MLIHFSKVDGVSSLDVHLPASTQKQANRAQHPENALPKPGRCTNRSLTQRQLLLEVKSTKKDGFEIAAV